MVKGETSALARRISGKRGGGQLQLCATPSPLAPFSMATLNISVAHCMPLFTRLNGSRMMSPPGFQIELRPLVTLTFDLLSPEVNRSCRCSGRRLCQFALKLVHSFSKYSVHKLVTDKRTNKRTDGRTKGHVENITPPASLQQNGVRVKTLCSRTVLRSFV